MDDVSRIIDDQKLQLIDLQTRYQDAQNRLMMLQTEKEELLGNLSHKLRTPLTAIKSFAEILIQYPEESAETKLEFIQIINKEADRLVTILSELLDGKKERPESASSPSRAVVAKSILIVDDEDNFVRSFEYLLKKEGHFVISAHDPESAVSKITQCNPDIVFLDVQLGTDNGYTLCQQWKSRYNIPIIMITAHSEKKDRMQGLNAGADAFISKPFSYNEIQAVLFNLFK